MPPPKERPILFSAPMVRAILDGRKTVTRRPVKVQPFDLGWSRRDHKFEYTAGRAEDGDEIDGFYAYSTRSGGEWSAKCPYGQPGDRLWVRETWAQPSNLDPGPTAYRATYPDCLKGQGWENLPPIDAIRWKPSIHMFRRDSRILLEIIAVRVERLQDISDEQAMAEGAVYPIADHLDAAWRVQFQRLWESINGPGSWDVNPWVWVVEFKRVTL